MSSSLPLSLVLGKPGLYIMLDKCSHTESLPFVSLICDHIDLLGFLDEDCVLLHPHSLCFTYLDCLCQTPTIHIMLISFTSSSETPMRLLSKPLLRPPWQPPSVLDVSWNALGTLEHVPNEQNLCVSTVFLYGHLSASHPATHLDAEFSSYHSLPVLLFITSCVLP